MLWPDIALSQTILTEESSLGGGEEPNSRMLLVPKNMCSRLQRLAKNFLLFVSMSFARWVCSSSLKAVTQFSIPWGWSALMTFSRQQNVAKNCDLYETFRHAKLETVMPAVMAFINITATDWPLRWEIGPNWCVSRLGGSPGTLCCQEFWGHINADHGCMRVWRRNDPSISCFW